MNHRAIIFVLALAAIRPALAGEPGPGDRGLPSVYAYRAADIDALRKGFTKPPREAGPWVYWFWFDNVVTREEISRELEEMAAAGIAGAELRSVTMNGFPESPGPWYDREGWNRLGHKRLEYLSDEYLNVLEHTCREARRLGLKLAINMGMGWPPGGAWITDEFRSKHLVARAHVLEGPRRVEGETAILVPPKAMVHAWKLAESPSPTTVAGSFRDLGGQVRQEGRLRWDVPPGRWLVGVFEVLPGGVCDKGAGAEADPGSREAVLFHLNHLFGRLDPRIGRYYGSTLIEVASDSWEYEPKAKARYWSPGLAEAFRSVGGGSLDERLYALLGYGPDRDRVLADLARAERLATRENFFATATEFLHQRNLRHRPQVRGRGLARDFFEAYGSADVPEVEEEVYLPEAVWVSHTLGLPITSAEAVTFISGHARNLRRDGFRGPFSSQLENPEEKWKTTPLAIRQHVSAHLARGINRVQLHGFSYSPLGVPAPGWRMYAEVHLNRNSPLWPSMKGLSTWIARNQWVLQAGGPVADAVVYPVRANSPNGPYNTADDQPVSAYNAVDAASPATLAGLARRDGEVPYDFKQLVLMDDVKTVDEARHLGRLLESGVSLVSCKVMPQNWSVLQSQAGASGQLDALRRKFDEAGRHGRIRDARAEGWQAAVASLQSVHWSPAEAQLTYLHRRVRGGEVYFVMNWGDRFRGQVSFPESGRTAEVWNADTGTITRAGECRQSDGKMAVALDLEKLQSTIVVFAFEP